jgi:GAF domain-containing protein
MHDAAFHQLLPVIAPGAVLAAQGDPALEALERYAGGGCSACARALVNAREHAVLLASSASGAAPRAGLRERILGAARARAAARPDGGAAAEASGGGSAVVRDPSATVAHHHVAGPDEAARAAAVDALDAFTERAGEGTARILAEAARLIGFPLMFVSIVRGDRVGYRVCHGALPGVGGARFVRREMSYCTHCVSAGAPLVVEDAAAEPFFRGSKMVRRFGIRAYAGVPLRTSSGIVIGTLCGLDSAPRRVPAEVVHLLERFAALVIAEIEGPSST